MISYSFSDTNKAPLYEQLYNMIRNDILSGVLKKDSRLPSKRSLSKQLSVSVITIENAYNQLVSEGYIYSKPKSGFFVSDILPNNYSYISKDLSYNSSQTISDKINNNSTYNQIDNVNDNSNDNSNGNSNDNSSDALENTLSKSKSPSNFADLSSNANEPSAFPFATWAKLNRRILSENQDTLMANSPSNGLGELRTAIADFLRGFRGIYADPENIIIGAGTETIYNILVQLLGYDRIYATEDPGYKKIALTLEANNVKTIPIPLDESGINPIYLEENNVDVVHTTPSHHFPTGITMPIKRRYELLNWANKEKSQRRKYIIEDDYDSEFRLTGLPIPALMSIDKSDCVIYMNTFTKSLASTIRISYMILPDHLMNLYHQKLSFYSCPVSTFEQLTLAYFMSEGYFEKHINRMRTAAKKKRELLLKTIKSSPLSRISKIKEEQSGLHFLLNLRTKKNQAQILEACHKEGIHLSFIEPNSGSKELSCMINYSSIPYDYIQEIVKRLEIALF